MPCLLQCCALATRFVCVTHCLSFPVFFFSFVSKYVWILWISKGEPIKINLISIRHKLSSGISHLSRHMGDNFTLSHGPFTRTRVFISVLSTNFNQNTSNDKYFKVEMMFRQKKRARWKKNTTFHAILFVGAKWVGFTKWSILWKREEFSYRKHGEVEKEMKKEHHLGRKKVKKMFQTFLTFVDAVSTFLMGFMLFSNAFV